MNNEAIEQYAHHLGNMRLKHIGLDEIFPKSKNPYNHLELIAGVDDETSNRSNNFEVTSINYKTKDAVDGWDDIQMNTLEGVTIQSGSYGEVININNANLSNCSMMGGSIHNPLITIDDNTMITIGTESFTAKELAMMVKALGKIREVYPEVFIQVI